MKYKNQNKTLLFFLIFFAHVTNCSTPHRMQHAHAIPLQQQFADLFARQDVQAVMQDPLWKKYVLYARYGMHPHAISQADIDQKYKQFQHNCYVVSEETRCRLVMDITKFFSYQTQRADDSPWEEDFKGLEEGFTRYIPDFILSWFATVT